jgi:phage shock protein PspC (stress-responsive transcriptional regulator)
LENKVVGENRESKISWYGTFKGTLQRKLTGVVSGINRKLMISYIVVRFFYFIFYGFCPFIFKETLFGVLQNFRVAFLDRVARADQLSNAVPPYTV